jgi:hypothetical protein
MQYKFYVLRHQQLVKILSLTVLLALMLVCFSASAQKHNNQGLTYGGGRGGYNDDGGESWGVALNAGYDVPSGNLGTIYKAAPTFGISVLHNLGNFTYNITIGYVSYKPKLDTFYNDEADHTAGYIKYGSFSSIEFFAGAAYNFAISDQAKFYLGLNIGSYYNHFAYDANDGIGDENVADNYSEQSYIAPKVGIQFPVSDYLNLGIEAKYNFLLSSSSGSGDAYDYGYSTTVYKSFSGNIQLIYNF